MALTEKFKDRVRFFHAQAGGRVGYSMATAWELAKAEERAEDLGWQFSYQDEDEPWDGECEAPEHVLCCYIWDDSDPWRDRHGNRFLLGSVGMVGVNSLRDPYLRVVAAELYSEALDNLDDAHEKMWTDAAAEMAGRATYAAGPS